MKVVVKDSKGKVLQKFWGNLICIHDLDEKIFKVTSASGDFLETVSEPRCVYENELDGSLTVEA